MSWTVIKIIGKRPRHGGLELHIFVSDFLYEYNRNGRYAGAAVVSFFINHSAEYELQAQLCTDLTSMPMEDGSAEWPQDQSPYQPIDRLAIPAQNAYSPTRRVYADDVLTFNPFHCLPEHRPLGSIMRARRLDYETSSRYRHQMNAQPRVGPPALTNCPIKTTYPNGQLVNAPVASLTNPAMANWPGSI